LRSTETTLDLTASFCRPNAHSCTGEFLTQVDRTVALMTDYFPTGDKADAPYSELQVQPGAVQQEK